jgi:hypothetical protein
VQDNDLKTISRSYSGIRLETLRNGTNNLAQKVGKPAEDRTRYLPDTSLQHLLNIVTILINYQPRLYKDKKLKMSGNSHVPVRGPAMLLVTSHELCGPERFSWRETCHISGRAVQVRLLTQAMDV